MMIILSKKELEESFSQYSEHYKELQKEVCDFVRNILKSNPNIDISEVQERQDNEYRICLKTVDSIFHNITKDPDKYKKYDKFTDIRDIAGVRITCHCRSDFYQLQTILPAELTKNYKIQKKDSKENEYQALHIDVAKNIDDNGSQTTIYCEIQIRTVLANAWAILDHRYRYKNSIKEGEADTLANALSGISKSCESLWELVKQKNIAQSAPLPISGKKPAEEQIPKVIEAEVQDALAPIREIKSRRVEVDDWVKHNREEALGVLNKSDSNGYFELVMYVPGNNISIDQLSLKNIASNALIPTFGWPIGVILDRKEYKPTPRVDGIAAEIIIDEVSRNSYDYWYFRKSGEYYTLTSLFEDERFPERPGVIFFDTRIIRVTEALLLSANLYHGCGVDPNVKYVVEITHGGLKNRVLTSASPGRDLRYERICVEDEVHTSTVVTQAQIKKDIVSIVKSHIDPLFTMFDFFKIDDKVLAEIVTNYVHGKVV
jgi:ppGpp synthetase/RelA/SpoT-type nucleotidyltranferase